MDKKFRLVPQIEKLIRNDKYMSEFYDIREEIKFTNTKKYFGFTKSSSQSIIITEQAINDLNTECSDRIEFFLSLVDMDYILVENIWLEYKDKKYSKETYKNEYEIYNLKYYLQQTHGENTHRNFIIIRNLITKLNEIHSKFNQAHLNISVHNIYFNEENEVFYGPIRLGLEDDDLDLWYSAIEHMFIPSNLKMNVLKSDIWSVGCIISELFFLATPLFQCINSKDKIRLPKMQDVDYMSPKEHNVLCNMYSSKKDNYRPFIYDLIDFEQSSLNNLLFELILSCICYNPKKRPTTSEILHSISYMENMQDRKSNNNFNSANSSKHNSYSESINYEGNKKLVNKDPYLESIRNRSRLIKFETSNENNNNKQEAISNNAFDNELINKLSTFSKSNSNLRSVSSEPSKKHLDNLTKKEFQDNHLGDLKTFKLINNLKDFDKITKNEKINDDLKLRSILYKKPIVSEEKNDDFKLFNSKMEEINDLLSKIGKDRELNDLLKLKK